MPVWGLLMPLLWPETSSITCVLRPSKIFFFLSNVSLKMNFINSLSSHCHFRPLHYWASLNLSSLKRLLKRLKTMFLKQKWKMMKDGKNLDFFVLTVSKWLKIKTLGYFHYSIFFKLYSRHCSVSSSFYFISVTKHNKRTPQSFNLMPALCEPGKKCVRKISCPT